MKTLITAMKTSISEVMETMFYLPVEFGNQSPFSETGVNEADRFSACRLKFSGDFSGQFILAMPKDLMAVMAENFMGESIDDLTEEHLVGTLTETLNMVSGNTLSKLDSENPFELDTPQSVDISKIPANYPFMVIDTTVSAMAIHVTIN